MSDKIAQYKERKRIEAEGLPIMYVVHSSPVGVDDIIEVQVTNINRNAGKVTTYGIGNDTKIEYSYDTYTLEKGFPSEVDIKEGEISSTQEGHGSGFGDLWSWTYYCTIDKDDAEAYFEKETQRVNEKYLKKSGKYILVLSSSSGDWEGLFIDGNLIDEGHKLGGGEHAAIYWLNMSEKHSFKANDIRFASVEYESEDDEYLDSAGSFPSKLSELKGKY